MTTPRVRNRAALDSRAIREHGVGHGEIREHRSNRPPRSIFRATVIAPHALPPIARAVSNVNAGHSEGRDFVQDQEKAGLFEVNHGARRPATDDPPRGRRSFQV
jgi:hypothetical protein